MDEATAAKNPKKPAFKFVEACLRDLKLPPGECFTLSDLFGDDTTGFVKVCENHRLTPSQYIYGGHYNFCVQSGHEYGGLSTFP